MSMNLYWEVPKPNRGKPLSKGMKWAIEKEYGLDSTLTSADIPFLKSVKAAQFGTDDEVRRECDLLIAVIEEHGTVRVWIG